MKAIRFAMLAAAAMMLSSAVTHAQYGGGYSSPQQYYSGWQHSANNGYNYRTYYYKPTPDYSGYKHHYVIQQDNYNYFYNPYQKQYWGRCPSQTYGKPQYSLLPPEARKPTLKDIPQSAFPPPGDLPPIPDSPPGSKIKMDLPPDDLPQEVLSAQ